MSLGIEYGPESAGRTWNPELGPRGTSVEDMDPKDVQDLVDRARLNPDEMTAGDFAALEFHRPDLFEDDERGER